MSSVFKIYSPEDCDFYYDGELQGHIESNSKKAFRFEVERKGVYRLEFINSEYHTELMMKVSIDADEEREVELDFSEVNEPVIRERERERIIIAIEHDYESELPKEIISAISNNGIVTIPEGVRKIRNMAFIGHGDLTSITIPNSVTEIGDYAFSMCSSLTSVTIPDSVTKIGRYAFRMCRNLTRVTIPDRVTKIEDGAFMECSSLTSISIPDSVTLIGRNAFYRCSSLTSIYHQATTPPMLCSACFFSSKSDLKIYVPKSESSTVLEEYKSAKSWKDYAGIIKEYDFEKV